jgi:LytS/YehU family sensor histidine kinase
MKLFSYWLKEEQKAHAIREEKSQAELNFLRNQFHPHFIFNALNSLYSKILSKSEQSADIVLKISSLLRFSIYDINARAVALEKEISYLKDYIALQRIRFDKRLDLSFTIEGSPENKIIEPFIIIPFIENSFKYCMGEHSAMGWITISISIADDWITLKVENSKDDSIDYTRSSPPGSSNGVGLDNVKRRLQLLYPDDHTLKITNTEDSYFVFLKFKLGTYDH